MGSDEEEIIDLHSMKVVELKQELKSRGLTVSGTKAELIDRLEKYMTEHEGVEAVEEEELLNQSEQTKQAPPPPVESKKVAQSEKKSQQAKRKSTKPSSSNRFMPKRRR